MKRKLINTPIRGRFTSEGKAVFLLLVIVLFCSCNKSDDFYEKLSAIPQISNESTYRYLPAYGIGDTLTITGFLYPDKGMRIRIGDVEDVPIAKRDSSRYAEDEESPWLNSISVIITEGMGIGNDRPVEVTSNNYTTQGASIQIYGLGGEGSVNKEQKLSLAAATSSRQNVYFNCVNGTGDVYYYGFSDKALYRLPKGGNVPEILLTGAELQTDQDDTFSISSVAAGGVNPQGTIAYASLFTGTEYRFCAIDLQTKKVTTLNRSTTTRSPYEGKIGDLQVVFSGVFPDDKGNVYLYVGPVSSGYYGVNSDASAQAVARYNSATGQVDYLFRTRAAAKDMPGTDLDMGSYGGYSLRMNAADATLYVFLYKIVFYGGLQVQTLGLDEYQLQTGTKTGSFQPVNTKNADPIYLGPIQYIRMWLRYNPQANTLMTGNFGMMPLPDRRGLFLYQDEEDTSSQFPKWLVIDFANNNLYQWAPGALELSGYYFSPQEYTSSARLDQLLNYDDEGQLYMTASARASIVKTTFK